MNNCYIIRIHLVSIFVLIAGCSYRCQSFAPLPNNRQVERRDGLSSQLSQKVQKLEIKTEDDNNGEQTDPKGNRKETLVFIAEIAMVSDPLPSGTTTEDVTAFFKMPENRNYLLSSGGEREVEEVPMTPELKKMWRELCQTDYGMENVPNDDSDHSSSAGDCVLACDSVIQFPGLKLTTTTYTAAKYHESDKGLPQYSLLLIGDKQNVSGLPPVVSIFNRMTGNEDKNAKNSIKPSGISKSTVSVVKENGSDDDSDDGSMVIDFDATLKIVVNFPAFLLKILPTSKEKAEAKGSASIMKSLKPSIEKSIEGVYDAFVSYKTASNLSKAET